MKEQFSNILPFSFYSYIENKIIGNGEAYINTNSRFYAIDDKRLPTGLLRYSSPFKQFVYDSSISGATIISGISINNIFVPNGTSGVSIDFDNGSVLVPSSLGRNAIVSGNYSIKDFNFYRSNELNEDLLFQDAYRINSRFSRPVSGIEPYSYVLPAIFVTNRYSENTSFQIGAGIRTTKSYVTCLVAHDKESYLEASLSILRDLYESSFAHLQLSDDPINALGNLKSGTYSYSDLARDRFSPSNHSFIESCRVSKISDSIKANPNLFYGIADFTILTYRNTKIV